MSSKAFTAQTFRFLHQVNTDGELPASDMKVAMAFTWYFNEAEDGQARVGCGTVGKRIGLSETTVIRSLHRLEARGHIRVVWGKQGRGHPNHVWMVIKPAPAQVLEAEKPAPALAGKPAPVKIKPAPAQENLLKNHREPPKKEAPIGEREEASLALGDPLPASGGLEGPTPGSEGAPSISSQSKKAKILPTKEEQGYAELRRMWTRGHPGDERAWRQAEDRRAFDLACRKAAPDQILAGALKTVQAVDAPKFLPTLAIWLDTEGWTKEAPSKARTRAPRSGNGHARRSNGGKPDMFAVFCAQAGFDVGDVQ